MKTPIVANINDVARVPGVLFFLFGKQLKNAIFLKIEKKDQNIKFFHF